MRRLVGVRVQYLVVLAIAVLPHSSGAEEVDPFDLEAHVSSATFRSQPLSDVPSSVSVITREDIRDFDFRTLAEALSSVHGIFVSSDRDYSFAGLRGFGPLGDWNSRVLMLLDGHPLVGSVYADCPLDREFPVDIGAVERIEVVRGPGSALYGTNAVFAIVNVVTREQADGRPAASISGTTSNRGHAAIETDGVTPTGWKWFVQGAGYGGRGPDLQFDGSESLPSPGWSRGADGERGGSVFGSLESGPWSARFATSRRTKEVPTGAYGTVFGDDRTLTRDNWSLATLEHFRPFGEHAIQTRLSYVRAHYRGDWLYANDLPDTGSYVFADEADGQKVELDARALLAPWPSLRVTAGLQGQRNFRALQKSWNVGVDANDVVQEFDRPFDQSAVYLQTEWQASATTALLGGLRVENHSHLDVTVNPRVGLVWHATPRATIKALAGRAFRAPNLYEMFYEDEESSKPNPNLAAETVESYETSFELRMARGLSMTVSGFRNELNDWIGVMVDESDGFSVYRNQGSFAVHGTELELAGSAPSGLRWRVGYDYARPDTETDPPNFARQVGQASLVKPLPWRASRVAILVRGIGERRNYAGAHVDPYVLTNLTYGFDPWDALGVTVTIQNLFDADASDPAGAEHTIATIPKDGRQLQARVRILF